MPKYTKQEVAEAKEACLRFYPKGSTVYTILRHVSRSGMAGQIGMLAIQHDDSGKLWFAHPNHSVAVLLGYARGNDAVKAGGCGMDMGFHIAHTLSSILYGDGYALKHEWL